jgi:transcriptional regulator with XRE-family HTH domain
MTRVEVRAEMLQWACERAGFDIGALTRRIPQLPAWESGEKQPTLKQLEGFAKATHTPVGYLFLPEPPVERVPIPDFRTVANAPREVPPDSQVTEQRGDSSIRGRITFRRPAP